MSWRITTTLAHEYTGHMVGILVQLIISWALLSYFEK